MEKIIIKIDMSLNMLFVIVILYLSIFTYINLLGLIMLAFIKFDISIFNHLLIRIYLKKERTL